MKRKFRLFAYTLGIGGFAFILYLIVSTRIEHSLFGYKPLSYKNELDSLFRHFVSVDIKVKYAYRSGDKGSIYYVTDNNELYFTVIEANNFDKTSIKNISIENTSKIKLTQSKTYATIVNNPFPLIQQMLNPKESSYIKILFEEPFNIARKMSGGNFYYLKGDYSFVSFSNTQNTCIVSFRTNKCNEILVLEVCGKIYFITQAMAIKTKSLLEIIEMNQMGKY